jgi:peroxiredoxin
MKTKFNFIYKIIIDNDNYLPIEIFQKDDLNNDFIKTSFTNLSINPTAPSETSWYYTTYTNDYKPAENTDTPKLLSIGSIAPDWKLQAYNDGKQISLNNLKGKVILLDFWIKNCGPCIESVPHLNKLKDKFQNNNFELLSINSYDSKEDIKWFFDKHKIKYTILMNGKDVAEKYGVSGFPSFFIIDKTGKIIYSREGFEDSVQSEIEAIIKNAL